MYQPSPGVERVVQLAEKWSRERGSSQVVLVDLVRALFDEVEGRPAGLVEKLGVNLEQFRQKLNDLSESDLLIGSPPIEELFERARKWSIAYRADPEFMTDAFLLIILKSNADLARKVHHAGLDPVQLEQLLRQEESPVAREELASDLFTLPDTTDEIDAARILDVNLNRARESLRILEDYARFIRDDRMLSESIKTIRHELVALSQQIAPTLLLAARETIRDVGTTITASGEYERASPAEVALVNLKRLQESLRSLEEYGKIFGSGFARAIEALRYRLYTLEKSLCATESAIDRLKGVKLYVLLTASQCEAGLDWTITEAARGGAGIFQLREKSLTDREFIIRAREVRQWTRRSGTLFIVNDRPDIARLSDADGVHLGQEDLTIKDARRILGPKALIGMSTHTIEQVRQAVIEGADYIGIGPTFPSTTKAFDCHPGLEFIRAATAETSCPAFALGGISTTNIAQVVAAGARRVAVSAAIAKADDPEKVARQLVNEFGR